MRLRSLPSLIAVPGMTPGSLPAIEQVGSGGSAESMPDDSAAIGRG
jgi:hypothetical protein